MFRPIKRLSLEISLVLERLILNKQVVFTLNILTWYIMLRHSQKSPQWAYCSLQESGESLLWKIFSCCTFGNDLLQSCTSTAKAPQPLMAGARGFLSGNLGQDIDFWVTDWFLLFPLCDGQEDHLLSLAFTLDNCPPTMRLSTTKNENGNDKFLEGLQLNLLGARSARPIVDSFNSWTSPCAKQQLAPRRKPLVVFALAGYKIDTMLRRTQSRINERLHLNGQELSDSH